MKTLDDETRAKIREALQCWCGQDSQEEPEHEAGCPAGFRFDCEALIAEAVAAERERAQLAEYERDAQMNRAEAAEFDSDRWKAEWSDAHRATITLGAEIVRLRASLGSQRA